MSCRLMSKLLIFKKEMGVFETVVILASDVHKIKTVGHCLLWKAGSNGFSEKPEYIAWCVMDLSIKIHRMSQFFLLLVLTVFPGNAWAVQTHGAPEGLYVHQLAHVFYAAALCYLFWDIRRSAFRSRGWHFVMIFCVLMVLWNVVAFTGHYLASSMHSTYFTSGSGYLSTRLQGPFTIEKLLYYFTKLDHLFSVPALFFLYIGMRGIYRSSCEEEEV